MNLTDISVKHTYPGGTARFRYEEYFADRQIQH